MVNAFRLIEKFLSEKFGHKGFNPFSENNMDYWLTPKNKIVTGSLYNIQRFFNKSQKEDFKNYKFHVDNAGHLSGTKRSEELVRKVEHGLYSAGWIRISVLLDRTLLHVHLEGVDKGLRRLVPFLENMSNVKEVRVFPYHKDEPRFALRSRAYELGELLRRYGSLDLELN